MKIVLLVFTLLLVTLGTSATSITAAILEASASSSTLTIQVSPTMVQGAWKGTEEAYKTYTRVPFCMIWIGNPDNDNEVTGYMDLRSLHTCTPARDIICTTTQNGFKSDTGSGRGFPFLEIIGAGFISGIIYYFIAKKGKLTRY